MTTSSYGAATGRVVHELERTDDDYYIYGVVGKRYRASLALNRRDRGSR